MAISVLHLFLYSLLFASSDPALSFITVPQSSPLAGSALILRAEEQGTADTPSLSPSSVSAPIRRPPFSDTPVHGFVASPTPLPVSAPSPSSSPLAILAPAPAPTPSSLPALLRNATERLALLSVRAAWRDPLQRLTDWRASNGAHQCFWRGITCDASFSVKSISLSGYSLSGSLPAAIANLSSLTELNLSHNQLSGTIPTELGFLPFLTSVFLNHNELNSTIPSSLFSAPSLQFLILDNNLISGTLPSTVGNINTLRYLSISYNNLTGSLPIAITTLKQLSALYARSNRFTGTIPFQIGNLSKLVDLDLGINLLVEGIPPSIGYLTELTKLHLDNNLLEGPLPVELGNLYALKSMNLSHNSLNGTLAPGLAKLSSLEVLDLCFNNLGGTIPPSLGDLGMLRYLNVSFNNLTGTVLTTGALGKFGADSFAGNPGLCGAKLQSSLCEPNPPTDRKPQVIPVNSGYGKYEKNPDFGANAKIAIVVLGGVFTLVLLFSIIVCCVCSVRRAPYTQRSGAEAERSHSLGLDMVPSVRNARLEVYVQGMSANYETIVSHAGYFDTAHVIGKGRFATVYLSSMSGDKPLAVKVFNDPIAPEIFEEGMARLHGMAENVPVLLPIKGYYSSPVETAIFFDFMPNGSLFDVLQTSPALLDWGERIRIAVVVSEAVDQLHRSSPSRVVHQDLKSTNIVLDKDLKPYLADYCLMELLQRSVVETPGYTPPEFTCSSFSTRRYTEKSDVYSFGVILLELLTGKHPIADDRRTSSSFHKYRGVQAQAQPSSIDVSDEENDRSFDAELGLGGNLRLVTLVLAMEREGRVAELLSSIVRKTCPSPDYQIQAFELAIRCIDEESSSRPSMSEIATILKMLANPSKA